MALYFIIYLAATTSTTTECRKMDRAEPVIPKVIGDGTAILYANNGTRPLKEDAIKGQLGEGKWTVVCDSGADEEMRNMKQAVERLYKKIDILSVETVNPFLRIVAASILLYLIGKQLRDISTTSSEFMQQDDP